MTHRETTDSRKTAEPRTRNVLISFLSIDQDDFEIKKGDTTFMESYLLDGGAMPENRHQIWRPSVALALLDRCESICEKLVFDKYYLLWDEMGKHQSLLNEVRDDINAINHGTSRELIVENPHIGDVFDSKSVYEGLTNYFSNERFRDQNTQYYVNCTSGTTAIRNCLFLLTQNGLIKALRISPTPWKDYRQRDRKKDRQHSEDGRRTVAGSYTIEDPRDFTKAYNEITQNGCRTTYRELSRNITAGSDSSLSRAIGKLARVVDSISRLKDSNLRQRQTILLTGETGVGKTLLARNIATALGNENFITRNCATICGADPNIARMELFGAVSHQRNLNFGAQDGALKEANGGVLFLDEIGELPLPMQSMLLTAIDNGKFVPLGGNPSDCQESKFQLICGTNQPLEQRVDEGLFRRDLFNRINAWHFEIPPLREHIDDLEPHIRNRLARIRNEYDLPPTLNFTQDALNRLLEFGKKYSWNGNFRELNAMITRMVVLSNGLSIEKDVVEAEIEEATKRERRTGNGGTLDKLLLPAQLEALNLVERSMLELVVRTCAQANSQAEAARILYQSSIDGKGVRHDSQLSHCLKSHGLTFEQIHELL